MRKNNQKGVAMVFVICIMAVLAMLSLALLLASSVMVSNAQKSKAQAQARILAISLANQVDAAMTINSEDVKKYQTEAGDFEDELEAEQVIPEEIKEKYPMWTWVNEQITSGQWRPYVKGDVWSDSMVLKPKLKFDAVSDEVLDADDCSAQIYWERETSDSYDGAELTVRLTVTVKGMSHTVTSVYSANDGYTAGEERPDQINILYWVRSERK